MRDGHSSGTTFARCLEQPTRTASLTSPCGVFAFANEPALPSLFGFAPGVVCHAASVAGGAVRSYRTFSPLPRVALAGFAGRFVLCGTVPGATPRLREKNPAGCYPAPYVDGARTFLPRSLSALAGAAVQPTDALGMGAQHRQVKVFFSSLRGALATKQSSSCFATSGLLRSSGGALRRPLARNDGRNSAVPVKINYPEDVVLRFRRSTGCRRNAPSKRELTRCSICC
jgi:hypothetical protein